MDIPDLGSENAGTDRPDTLLARLLAQRDTGEEVTDSLQTELDQLLAGGEMGFPGEILPEEEAIAVDEDVLERLQLMVFEELEGVVGERAKLNARIKLWRDLYDLEPGPEPYEDAPNFTVPLARSKVRSFVANVRAALDKQPFMVTEAMTAEATRAKPAWEAAMRREFDRVDTRRQLFMAAEEAAIVGTGPLRYVAWQAEDQVVLSAKALALEDFYVSPPSNLTVADCSVFCRFEEPTHLFVSKVEQGIYDEERAAVALSAARKSTKGEGRDQREETYGTTSTSLRDESDNTPLTLWEVYYRHGGKLYRLVVERETRIILRATRSPFREFLGEVPPFHALRPIPRKGYFYGDSFVQVLEGPQGVTDWGMNSILAYNQLAITPTGFMDEESVIEKELSVNGRVIPGKMHKTNGQPRDAVHMLELPPPVNAERMIELAQHLGDKATFHDATLGGQPLGTVRTATEHQILQNSAQVLLGEAVGNIAADLMDFGDVFWKLFYHLKVKPEGVYEVFRGESDQFLLGTRQVESDELTEWFVEFCMEQGLLPPDAFAAYQAGQLDLAQLGVPDVQLFIAGADRSDLMWKPQGGETLVDRALRIQKHEKLFQYAPLIEAAQMLPSIWNICKGYLESLEIMNWRDYIPPEPPSQEVDLTTRLQILGVVSEQVKSMRQGGGGVQ